MSCQSFLSERRGTPGCPRAGKDQLCVMHLSMHWGRSKANMVVVLKPGIDGVIPALSVPLHSGFKQRARYHSLGAWETRWPKQIIQIVKAVFRINIIIRVWLSDCRPTDVWRRLHSPGTGLYNISSPCVQYWVALMGQLCYCLPPGVNLCLF